jgi:GH24 family phage-related lysozyme (muramidase)
LKSTKTSHGYEEHWTVGIGHYGKEVLPGDNVFPKYEGKKIVNAHTYTDSEVQAFFVKDSDRFTKDVNKIWTSDMTQNMFDAMFSFAYNHGNISSTQLGRAIKNGGWKNQSNIRTIWTSSYVSGKYHDALLKRRKAEVDFFYSGSSTDSSEPYDSEGSSYPSSGNSGE